MRVRRCRGPAGSRPTATTRSSAAVWVGQHELRDERRARLRARIDDADADEPAQRARRTATAAAGREDRQPRRRPAARSQVRLDGPCHSSASEVGQGEDHEGQRSCSSGTGTRRGRCVPTGPTGRRRRSRSGPARGSPSVGHARARRRAPGRRATRSRGCPSRRSRRVVAGEALLVEPDRLQVERPRPPRRRRRVRRRQAVVVVVHLRVSSISVWPLCWAGKPSHRRWFSMAVQGRYDTT